MYFWIPWGVDLIVALLLLVFLVIGLSDGSVSSDNSGLWLLMFLVVAGVLGGSFALRAGAHETLATILAAMLALPSILVGLGFLAMAVLPGRWN
ncbi:MAG: osmoprotectant transporter permease [Bradyrhizobium sp.]|uniref:hypothetical protein n=1 Tax=Bradyrhizobium sp. TaxID=376 RepID=UPI0025B86C50|nr:hypothetical protein [Bradyrhizobium sp.]MBI5261040.1 osmoprotectant transporter permease [Bradyrhizobium sp.]